MPKNADRGHSILIVSASEQFEAIIKQSLRDYVVIDSGKSAAHARRRLLEKAYDLVAINAPLPDETGEQLALDIAEQTHASVLLVMPSQVYDFVLDQVTDRGILVLPKPMQRSQMEKAVRFLTAVQGRIHQLEKQIRTVEDKMEEIRLVSQAKLLLMQKKQMTEDEAHRYIGRQAMNNGVSRKRVAERIVDDLE